jgi:hypothetical protein
MNVLSLFDGMSCGQIAFDKLGVKFDGVNNKYFASEIKKHAIETTQLNYPNTIQLGDVMKIKTSDLPKIDLLIGGSPCQDFSQCNINRKGLAGLKSNLFFEYYRLWKELNPKYYLLENVIMLPEHFATLCNYMETYPFETCGSLVSAALRRRLFWTNIGPYYYDLFGFRHCDIPQPKNKKISLQSILTDGFTDSKKAQCLTLTTHAKITSLESIKKRIGKLPLETIIYPDTKFDINSNIRFFNKTELERLHNIPEGYTKNLTINKAHDLIGDGWTVDIIAHIFSFLDKNSL